MLLFISEKYFIVCVSSIFFSMQILHERKHACFVLKINLVHSLSTDQSTKKDNWQWGFVSVLNWYIEKSGVGVVARNTKLVMNSCQGVQLNLKVFHCKPSEWVSQLPLVKIVFYRPKIWSRFQNLWLAKVGTFLPTSFHLDSQDCYYVFKLKLYTQICYCFEFTSFHCLLIIPNDGYN